jgi:hypothetical protein
MDQLLAALWPIVPQSVVDNGPYNQLCNLVDLANSVIGFAVYLAILVATIMFVYAGILYVTASANENNLGKAKKVFWSVFWGLVIVLASWLIINVILSILTPGGGLNFWTAKAHECQDYAVVTDSSGGSTVVVTTTRSSGPTLSNAEATARLNAAGITISSSGNCSDPSNSSCTSLEGIPESTVTSLIALKQQCPTCNIVVTGGTETGHATHGPGRPPVDLRFDQATADYIAAHRAELGITQVCTTNANAQYRYNCTAPESENHLHLGFGSGP